MAVLFLWWGRLELNQRPIGYAYHYNFRCLFRICGLDCLFIRVGCLPFSLYTFPKRYFSGLGSGLPFLKFRLPRI
jgi:hypothetical protein